MFHLADYTVAIAQTVDTDVPALSDDILSVQNNHFVLSQPLRLLAAAVMSTTLSRAKLASPSMRQIASPYVRPIILGATPGNNPNVWLLDHQQTWIQPYEEIQLQATSGLGTGNERFHGLIWLQDTLSPLPTGNVIPLRITSTTAAVANTWTTCTITFADTLPTGQYAMLLSEHQSATAIAHRWIVSNQVWRPGFLSFTTLGQRIPYAMSKGQFGVMGVFKSNDLPRLQVLCTGTDAAHEVYLDVVRIGNIY